MKIRVKPCFNIQSQLNNLILKLVCNAYFLDFQRNGQLDGCYFYVQNPERTKG